MLQGCSWLVCDSSDELPVQLQLRSCDARGANPVPSGRYHSSCVCTFNMSLVSLSQDCLSYLLSNCQLSASDLANVRATARSLRHAVDASIHELRPSTGSATDISVLLGKLPALTDLFLGSSCGCDTATQSGYGYFTSQWLSAWMHRLLTRVTAACALLCWPSQHLKPVSLPYQACSYNYYS